MRHLVQPKVIPQCGEIDKELVDPAVVVLRKIFRARTANDCGVKSFLPKLYEFAGKASYAGRRASRATARGDLDIGCSVFMPGTPAARTRHRCPPYGERCQRDRHADAVGGNPRRTRSGQSQQRTPFQHSGVNRDNWIAGVPIPACWQATTASSFARS